ncbi:hypothetical protein IR073_06470 [Gemella sp. 19428wG2_WT2a]|nr:hypothetical protein [Gemella sp. 19428wG2_WT2a]TFU57680.1 hypothetical protein E4T67_06395 [Gemella sp. WT2a]
MQLTINNKNYNLHFGLGFLQEMNKRKSTSFDGMSTGYGALALLSIGSMLQDPLAVVDVIKAATAQALQKPSNEDLEIFLNEKAENGQLDKLIFDLFEEIKKSPLLRYAMKMETGQTNQVPVQKVDTNTVTQIV